MELDWSRAALQSEVGSLMALLETLPRACLTERDDSDQTLLHYAGWGENAAAAAVLLAQGLDVNARDKRQACPAHFAAINGQSSVLEVLCAAEADLLARNDFHNSTPLDLALFSLPRANECVRVLVANGVRLSTAGEIRRHCITPELLAFERGVLKCRMAAVALLGLKTRRHVEALQMMDRWIVREVCLAIWATRAHRSWLAPEPSQVAPPPTDEILPLNWGGSVFPASQEGRLMTLLETLPRARWMDMYTEENVMLKQTTLLHFACCGDNVVAAVALIKQGLDVNAFSDWQACPAHIAATTKHSRMLEVLHAAGADLCTKSNLGYTPLDSALNRLPNSIDCVRVLLAHGVRLRTAHPNFRGQITSDIRAIERGVLRCRTAVVAVLCVKRVGRLWHWDKFLLAYLARDVWLTRCAQEWQGIVP